LLLFYKIGRPPAGIVGNRRFETIEHQANSRNDFLSNTSRQTRKTELLRSAATLLRTSV
jgi:hypothetical protein